MNGRNGMFDCIQQLRNETGRHHDLIGSRMCQTLKHLYLKCKRHDEFKLKAKNLLGW